MISLNTKYSTTKRLVKVDHHEMASLLKETDKSEEEFKTLLFFPDFKGRQGEGGLRTHGYFKASSSLGLYYCANKSEELFTSTDQCNIIQGEKNTRPLVTIITVVFNGEKTLEETILSVINQTYDNIEYIIIDGGSNDRTLEIMHKYDNAIDYWISEKDNGIYDAMNKGIDLATGQWINFMNSGDRFYKDDTLEEFGFSSLLYNKVIFGKSLTKYKSIKILRYETFNSHNKEFFLERMPNHQATFFPKIFYCQNRYNLKYMISSDKEFMSRAFNICSWYEFEGVVSEFELGGVSTYYNGWKNFILISKEDYQIDNKISVILKHFFKYFLQIIMRKDKYLNLYIKFLIKK